MGPRFVIPPHVHCGLRPTEAHSGKTLVLRTAEATYALDDLEQAPMLWRLLGAVGDGATAAEIMRRSRLPRETVTEAVEQLLELGVLVEQQPAPFLVPLPGGKVYLVPAGDQRLRQRIAESHVELRGGEGLARATARLLAETGGCRSRQTSLGGRHGHVADLTLLLAVEPTARQTDALLTCARRLRAAARPSLSAIVAAGQLWVGPLVDRRDGPCVNCLTLRIGLERERLRPQLAQPLLPLPALELASVLVALQTLEWLAGGNRERELVHSLSPMAGEPEPTARHLRVHPLCPDCAAAAEPLTRKRADKRFRAALGEAGPRPAARIRPQLAALVDDQLGVLHSLEKVADHAYSCSVNAPAGDLVGHGEADSDDLACVIAAAEGIERYCTLVVPPDLRRRRWDEVATDAVDPRTLTLYHPQQYRDPALLARPFRAGRRYDWKWCHDLVRDRARLVAHDFVRLVPWDERPLVLNTTSGAAAHSCLRTAALRALLEVLERHALLASWLHRRSPARLRLDSVPAELGARWRQIEHALPAQLTALDLSLPGLMGVTAVLAEVPAGCGGPAGARWLAASADPRPELSLAKALAEIATIGDAVGGSWEGIPLCEPPTRPAEVARYYLEPENARKMDFLTRGPEQPLASGRAARYPRTLDALVAALADGGLGALICDITTDDVREACELRVVRALVPGALPLYFGVPRLGLGPHPDQANPDHHPLP